MVRQRTADHADDLYANLMGMRADEVMAYGTLMGDLDPTRLMAAAVLSTARDCKFLKSLFALFGYTWHDMTDDLEEDKVIWLVADQEDMTPGEVLKYIEEEYTSCAALEENATHNVVFFDMEEDYWDQFKNIVNKDFTMNDVTRALQVAIETDERAHRLLIRQIVFEIMRVK